VWRYIPRGAHPLHVGFLLQASGRWNRFGEYGCLYTALTREGAVAEYDKALRYAGLARDEDAERDLVTVHVDVEPVMSIITMDFLRGSGLAAAELTTDTDESFEICRTIADYARAAGYCAIISPSAALAGQRNLTIYFDGRADRIHLDVGSVREPLNY
jgi:hypothetical protein